MFITVPNINKLSKNQFQAAIKTEAVLNVLSTALRSAQILLDNYLLKQHFKNLRSTCLELIANSACGGMSQQVTVIFPKKQDDQMAQLITYGNGQIGGSQILINAFKKATTKIQKPVDLLQADSTLEPKEAN